MYKPRTLEVGIADDVAFGEGVTVVMPSNLYGCKIGDYVFVGPFVEIQKGAVVGDRTRVQSHAFICGCVNIGEDCFVGHGVKFINDTFKTGTRAGGDTFLYQDTIIGNHVTIGTNATILPVTIAEHVCVGAGAVVTTDLLEPGIYAGNPARLIRNLDL